MLGDVMLLLPQGSPRPVRAGREGWKQRALSIIKSLPWREKLDLNWSQKRDPKAHISAIPPSYSVSLISVAHF